MMTNCQNGKPALIECEELIYDPDADTLGKILENACRNYPDKGIIYVGSKGDEDYVSNAAFRETCLKLLGRLQSIGFSRGDKVLLEIEDDKDFFFVFWACILGGIIPAPINPPVSFEEGSEALAKIVNVWTVLDRPAMITDEAKKEQYRKLNLTCLSVNDLQGGQNGAIYPSVRDDIAFLQFSSGSTGDPKGIIISHGNIVANIMQISIGAALTPEDVCCGWLPHTHDMGLIGQHMCMLYSGILQIKMHPFVFIRRPFIFVDKMTRHKATIICTPNFGLKWMIDNISEEECDKLDFSSLRIICNGAEPISANVIREFFRKFGRTGYREEAMFPAYGTAEMALGISFHPLGVKPLIHRIKRNKMLAEGIAEEETQNPDNVVEFADEGYPLKGISVRIVDSANAVVPERVIGEIQVRGPNLTRGYYNHPAANKAAFVAGWYKTGDLGFIAAGRLTITGRMKDILFVRGQNYYAHDLENVIYSLPDVAKGMVAVIGVHGEKSDDEEILVLCKHKGSLKKFLAIDLSIRRQLASLMGIEVTHVIPVKKIHRTTSGKLQRFKMRAEYERGLYDAAIKEVQALKEAAAAEAVVAHADEPMTDLENDIRRLWSGILKVPQAQIGLQSKFLDLGGTSIKALAMLAGLEKITGCELTHHILLACSTIRDVSEYLSSGAEEGREQTLREYVLEKTTKPETHSGKILHDIAVVGIALRFPGADNADELWDILINGKHKVSGIGAQRKVWAQTDAWDRFMAAVDSPDRFDASFFAVSDEEALFMDPQQRLMLMLAYEAMEDGCLIARTCEEMAAGVFIGASFVSYQDIVKKYVESVDDENKISPLALVGNSLNMLAARVSHAFNLTGPALTIDTACSSSLAAVEAAVAKLRDGSIDYALAGGVNLIFTPLVHRLSCRAGILSSGDKCRVFDIRADGTVLGEGAGMVLLQPLATALKENKKIYGVIKGVGINNDGDSLGPMAPNPKGQINVLAEAYRDAGIDPGTVSYLEAHGTGTYIGDPVEARALARFFREFSAGTHFCGVGSIKSNIGHLLPAAGIAGLLKTLLCLERRKLVPTLHVETVNPEIEIENSPLYMCTENHDWKPANGGPLRAGVSSFGFGGTNVHVVLEEAPVYETTDRGIPETGAQILAISGKTPGALEQNIERIKKYLSAHPDVDLARICFTRNVSREHFANRAFFLAEKTRELNEYFEKGEGNVLEGRNDRIKISGRRAAFIFPDAGPRQIVQASGLYSSGGLFARYVDQCLSMVSARSEDKETSGQLYQCFAQKGGWKSGIAPLAVFIADYALGRMWLDFGIKPQFVHGLGIGEYAAAVLAGIWSLEDALDLMIGLAGIMKKKNLSMESGNSPENSWTRCFEAMRPEAGILFEKMNYSKPVLKFAPTYVNPEKADAALSPDYWLSHKASSVSLADNVRYLQNNKCNIFLEAGLGCGMAQTIKRMLPDENVLLLETVNPEGENIVNALGWLYLAGYKIHWEKVYWGFDGETVSLPHYAFDMKSYFLGKP